MVKIRDPYKCPGTNRICKKIASPGLVRGKIPQTSVGGWCLMLLRASEVSVFTQKTSGKISVLRSNIILTNLN